MNLTGIGVKLGRIPHTPPTPTALLQAWGRGDAAARDQLMALVYDELRRLARRYMGRERPGHTLQPTALVNEAYLRLIEVQQVQWRNKTHFLAMAARVMRRVLVDAARVRRYQKRGGGAHDLLFGLQRTDPRVYAAAAGILFLVGLVSTIPALLRALRIDPITALRCE